MEFGVILFLVAAFDLTLAGTYKRKVDSIKYPEEINDDIPDKCKGLTYCTVKPDNYPTEKFNNMFKDLKVLIEPSSVNEVTFENRQGDASLENNCHSKVESDLIFGVRRSLESPFRIVVHAMNISYLQRVRREICINPEAQCFTEYGEVPSFITYCHQESHSWKFLVEKEGGNGTEEMDVELPTCCSCRYKLRSTGKK